MWLFSAALTARIPVTARYLSTKVTYICRAICIGKIEALIGFATVAENPGFIHVLGYPSTEVGMYLGRTGRDGRRRNECYRVTSLTSAFLTLGSGYIIVVLEIRLYEFG